MARRRRGGRRSRRQGGRQPKLGTGKRFARLKGKLSRRKGVRNSGALAASIGRKKFGKKRFAQLSARGRKRAARKRGGRRRRR